VTTALQKTLKRELLIAGRPYVVSLSPLTLKLTPKGKRKGLELSWQALVSGDAELAAALQGSVSLLGAQPRPEGVPRSSGQK
jgi:hypothetical protein